MIKCTSEEEGWVYKKNSPSPTNNKFHHRTGFYCDFNAYKYQENRLRQAAAWFGVSSCPFKNQFIKIVKIIISQLPITRKNML